MTGATLRAITLIVRRSLRQHAVSTLVTAASVALAVGLLMAVFSINAQTYRAFTGGPVGFDAVLGARGSQIQLVLNTVFHLETSPGNIPWSLYESIRRDPRVRLAIPYAVGDNFMGFRIVGTIGDLFSQFQFAPGGRAFDPAKNEAVIGQVVAEKTGLRVGSVFSPFHGVNFDENMRHADEFVVAGVLQTSHSPSDRVIWIPIDGVFHMTGHVLRGTGETYQPRPGEEIPAEHKEVSAVMLKLRNPQAGFMLDQSINRQGRVATLAWPIGLVMAELFDKMGWMYRILQMVAWLIVGVAGATVFAGVYNTIQERRRDFAILRALGARRRTVFSAVVIESAAITALGAAASFLVYGALLAGAAAVIRAQTGVVLDALYFHPALILGPIGAVALGGAVGIVPAIKAYATDVAAHLAPVS
ncbi:MAG: hypothetical protein A3G34_03405 [Candidatus Lindowbacteria bacterium RIFCSPLOWO2_12_FULL_62_27]|nr:MAG: hypothetical protein A3I06_07010 [Candidatus Lindowbacteria bacterium RIFCSPLOWO2_02_FULL_62_12]OGH62991.1 MAG: hypothetical protein A3G34_03405 [Candidatus Lindowbacteria bacterium RIFCSPLOWO2_12_FULL_62_27]